MSDSDEYGFAGEELTFGWQKFGFSDMEEAYEYLWWACRQLPVVKSKGTKMGAAQTKYIC